MTEGRNAEMCHSINQAENQLKSLEHHLYETRRDVDCQRNQNGQNRRLNDDLTHEREALQRHSGVLEAQNADLSQELDRFVQTDELLRSQLDRRSRVHGIQNKNHDELRHSGYRVHEARSRSPAKCMQTPSRH